MDSSDSLSLRGRDHTSSYVTANVSGSEGVALSGSVLLVVYSLSWGAPAGLDILTTTYFPILLRLEVNAW